MGYWSLIVPEATKNYLPNPSFETGTTGHTNYATGTADGTRARSLVWQKRAAYSYKIVKSSGGAADHYGFSAACSVPGDFDSGESATFSVDLNIAASTTVVIKIEATVGGNPESTTETITGPVEGRYDVTHTLSGDATAITAYIYISSTTGTFYADGLQVENKSYATTFCDGTRDGCAWGGVVHNSTSTRLATSRAGGREYNLDSYGYYVRQSPGIGMPPVKHLVHGLAQLPGALLRGFKIPPRSFTLVVTNTPSTRADLHTKRKALMAVLKPDLVNLEPVILRYTGANASKAVEIAVTYDGGLEFGSLSGFSEEGPIRFIAYDPFFYEDGDEAAELNTLESIASVNYVIRKENGTWATMGTGLGGASPYAFRIRQGPDNKIYFAGAFDSANGVADTDGVAAWDRENGTFSALSTGLTGDVHDLVWDAAGNLWVAKASGVYKWDGASWTTIATATSPVNSLDMAPDGTLYATGNFTTFDGVGRGYAVKSTDGGANWTELDTTGLNNPGLCVRVHPNGKVYFCGAFTTAGGTTVNGVAEYDPDTNNFAALGSGLDVSTQQAVWLLVSRDGSLFVTGNFPGATGISNTAGFVRWNGTAWEACGTGLAFTGANGGADLTEDENGNIWVVGGFTSAGGLALADRVAVWNRSTWKNPDIDLPGTAYVYSVGLVDSDNMYLGFNTSGTAQAIQGSTVNNEATQDSYPQIVFARSGGTEGLVQRLDNLTTGATLLLNYALQDGETLTLDLTPGQRSATSSLYGPVWSAVLQASNLATFRLVPGNNDIRTFISTAGSPTITAYMQWRNTHWSADGVAA